MLALPASNPVRYPPKFRFVEGLHEATAGDFRRFGEKAVINCTKLAPDAALKLCEQRIEALEAKIKERAQRGQRSDTLEESLEQERSWAAQLAGIAVIKLKPPSRKPRYESLVNDTQIKSVIKLGKTKQGVFYLVYTLDSGWKTCSFVATGKIVKALNFALEQRGKIGATIKEVIPVEDGSIKLRYNWNGTKTSSCAIADISPYLTDWNNSRISASDKPCLKDQLEAEATKRGLEFTALLDDETWCLRITKDGAYLGGVLIEGQNLIVSRVGYQGEVKARFPKGAIALIADALPAQAPDEKLVAEDTLRLINQRDRATSKILSRTI
jgi:hypothetical protein